MSYQGEAELEKQLINQLVDLGYQRICVNNEDGLIRNFKEQLSRHKKEALKGKPLTEKEFERVLRGIEGKSV